MLGEPPRVPALAAQISRNRPAVSALTVACWNALHLTARLISPISISLHEPPRAAAQARLPELGDAPGLQSFHNSSRQPAALRKRSHGFFRGAMDRCVLCCEATPLVPRFCPMSIACLLCEVSLYIAKTGMITVTVSETSWGC